MSLPTVLVVDDDAPVRRMLQRTLAAEGWEVRAAADGGAALAAVEQSVPDAIVLDVAMPGIDGLAVARRLRGKGLATPILLLTARDAVSDRVAWASGAPRLVPSAKSGNSLISSKLSTGMSATRISRWRTMKPNSSSIR